MTPDTLNLTFQNANLETAVATLRDLQNRKRDFVVPASRLACVNGEIWAEGVRLSLDDVHEIGFSDPKVLTLAINEVALEHISQKLEIPLAYLKRCQSTRPDLFDTNVNGWLQQLAATPGKKAKSFFVRTYLTSDEPADKYHAGILRAMLSDRYFAYDNFDLLTVVLATVRDEADRQGLNIRVADCDLSERRFFVRFTCPDIQGESEKALRNYRAPKGGDENGALGRSNGIVTGFVISNSEVGNGSLKIAPRVTILACQNGMIWNDEGYKRTHLGAQMDQGEIVWSEQTQRAAHELLRSQVRDMIRRYLQPDFLAQRIADIEAMAAISLEHPIEACRNIAKNHLGVSDDQADAIFGYFIQQGSAKTLFDVAQAATYFAQHDAGADLRFDVESKVTTLKEIAHRYDVKKPIFRATEN